MNDAPDPRMQGYNQPTEPVPPPDRRPYGAGGAYSQSQRESYVDPAGNRVENSVQIVEDLNVGNRIKILFEYRRYPRRIKFRGICDGIELSVGWISADYDVAFL